MISLFWGRGRYHAIVLGPKDHPEFHFLARNKRIINVCSPQEFAFAARGFETRLHFLKGVSRLFALADGVH